MEWMVADAVRCEPVSRANSPQTGNFTGSFFDFAPKQERGIAKTAATQRNLTKFPTSFNRENSSRIREFATYIREL
jgi:hypothetical protein